MTISSQFADITEFAEMYGLAADDPKLKHAYDDYLSAGLDCHARQRHLARLKREVGERGIEESRKTGIMREREKRTLALMVGIYCKGQGHAKRAEHGPGPHGSGLCPHCQNLVGYCAERIDRCPRQAVKTSCSACPTHCYKPDMRKRVREVMRYAGPRMLFYSPADAIRHVCSGRPKGSRTHK